jgi:hypothetical protein
MHSAMHQGEAFGQDLGMLQEELGEAFSAALEIVALSGIAVLLL